MPIVSAKKKTKKRGLATVEKYLTVCTNWNGMPITRRLPSSKGSTDQPKRSDRRLRRRRLFLTPTGGAGTVCKKESTCITREIISWRQDVISSCQVLNSVEGVGYRRLHSLLAYFYFLTAWDGANVMYPVCTRMLIEENLEEDR
jgi:hypothetical protein